MTERFVVTNEMVNSAVHHIVNEMYKEQWRPDYIVGITRGGLIPAVWMSHLTGIKMHTLDVRLRDGNESECESNCWMASDAFGYVDEEDRALLKSRWDPSKRKNILILDDINDSGATFNWIKKDWQSSCLPNEKDAWDRVWGSNVRFATIVENTASELTVDWAYYEVNKFEKDVWVEFPWEQWW